MTRPLPTGLRACVLLAMALGAGGCSAPVPEGRTLDLDTEVASFFLFHPDDLGHRKGSPPEWTLYEFAVGPEFAAGNLVAFDTGADGGYRIRLTTGDLSARERRYASCSWDFRYKVRHGRVLIDDGEHVPSDPPEFVVAGAEVPPHTPGPIPDERWFAVPNGDYKVTVTAIDWEQEPGAVGAGERASKGALPAYVIRFRPVERLDAIPTAKSPPRLEPGPKAEPRFYPVSVDRPAEEEGDEPLPKTCPVVVAPGLNLTPGFETPVFPLSARLMERLQPQLQLQGGEPPSSIPVVAFVDEGRAPRLGALGRLAQASGEEGGGAKATFQLFRLVEVAKIEETGGGLEGTIAAFERPKGDVPPAELTAAKTAFAAYARTNAAYRKGVKHPDYEAERVGAMTSPSAVSTTLLHHVAMPDRTRARLLPLSDAERLRGLLEILKGPN